MREPSRDSAVEPMGSVNKLVLVVTAFGQTCNAYRLNKGLGTKALKYPDDPLLGRALAPSWTGVVEDAVASLADQRPHSGDSNLGHSQIREFGRPRRVRATRVNELAHSGPVPPIVRQVVLDVVMKESHRFVEA